MYGEFENNEEQISTSTAPNYASYLSKITLRLLRNGSFRDRLLGIERLKGVLNENERICWLRLKSQCDRLEVSSVFKDSAGQLIGEDMINILKGKGYLKESKNRLGKLIVTIQTWFRQKVHPIFILLFSASFKDSFWEMKYWHWLIVLRYAKPTNIFKYSF